jgi:hypothetical protein
VAQSLESSKVNERPVIYHYTNAEGLIGILSSGKLWATDIRYLNDSSELLHAEKLQRQVLKELIIKAPAGSLQKRLAIKAQEHPPWHSRLQTYVVCFCRDDDLLTQWQAYAAAGSGFSIGFDRRELESLVPNPVPVADGVDVPDVSLKRIEYSEEKQKDSLRLSFNRYINRLPADPSQREIDDFVTEVAGDVARSASRFKHRSFRSEKEWRIVISSHPFAVLAREQLFFRPSSRTVIPYRKIPEHPNGKLPIVSVTVGPTLDRGLSVLAVNQLLEAKGYFDDRFVPITCSDIPLTRTD